MKKNGTRLENKIQREITNVNQKTELNEYSDVSSIKLNGVSILQEKQYVAKQQ